MTAARKLLLRALSTSTEAAAATATAATSRTGPPPCAPPGAMFVGAPDPASHIWPLHIVPAADETALEGRYREMRLANARFHHDFWSGINEQFQAEKARCEQEIVARGEAVTADALSRFYRRFLDERREVHRAYNSEVLRQSRALLWTSLRVRLGALWRR